MSATHTVLLVYAMGLIPAFAAFGFSRGLERITLGYVLLWPLALALFVLRALRDALRSMWAGTTEP